MSLNVTAKYANVFNLDKRDKVVRANVSTGRKNQNGDKVYSSWKANFFGGCLEDAKGLEEADTIEIVRAYISCEPGIAADGSPKVDDNGKKIYYTNLNIIEYNFVNHKGEGNYSKSSGNTGDSAKPTIDEDSEDLPF